MPCIRVGRAARVAKSKKEWEKKGK
jgi:hypothetical protein